MELNKFVTQKARPLPVIIMADTSGSMGVESKIDALNQALSEMIKSFAEESRLRAEIHVAVITFGGVVREEIPLTPAHQLSMTDRLSASGGTPLGDACKLVQAMLENKEIIPSRAYRPVIILASDGYPTDNYETAFQSLIHSERASKATRLALAIGNDADESLLSDFNNDLEAKLFHAHNASDIVRFFREVTMSVGQHSQSQTPNACLDFKFRSNDTDSVDDDNFDLDF